MRLRMIIARPLILMLAAAFLISFGIQVARIGTTYKSVALGLPPAYVGLLAAAFAVVPMLLVIWFGRLTDRYGVRPAMLIGAGVIVAGVQLLWQADGLGGCFAGMALLGIGQTLHYSGLQMVIPLVSTRSHRDAILGNYLLASSLGGATAPLLIAAVGSEDPAVIARLLLVGAGLSVALLFGVAMGLSWVLRDGGGAGPAALPRVGEVVGARGLPAILVAGSTCTTAQDLLVTYMPALGIARSISPSIIGILLAAESVASALSRAGFSRLTRRFGSPRLALVSSLIAAAGIAALAAPLPVSAMFVALPVAGYGLGTAATATLAMLLAIAPRNGRATAMSMRQLGNRVGLFALPTGFGMLAAALGVGGLFAVLGGLVGMAGLLAARGSAKSQS